MSIKPVCMTLMIPALFEALSRQNPASESGIREALSLARCSATEGTGYEAAVLERFGFDRPDRSGLPAARLTYLMDFNESATASCTRADPVHLRAERDHARLIPPEALSLGEADTAELIDTLNKHFNEDGLCFVAGRKHRWYVTGGASPPPDSAPTNQVAGRDVSAYLPIDRATAHWRRLSNEVQMLLHDHPVNLRRQQAGQVPVNALWFWGGGALPVRNRRVEIRLFSNAAYALGLARCVGLTGYPQQDLPLALQQVTRRVAGARDCLWLNTSLLEAILAGDEARERDELQVIDTLVRRTLARLRRGGLAGLCIDPCQDRFFELSRWRSLQFWRRAEVPMIAERD